MEFFLHTADNGVLPKNQPGYSALHVKGLHPILMHSKTTMFLPTHLSQAAPSVAGPQ